MRLTISRLPPYASHKAVLDKKNRSELSDLTFYRFFLLTTPPSRLNPTYTLNKCNLTGLTECSLLNPEIL